MDGKTLRTALALAVIAVAIFLALLWQPSRQVRLHQAHLLRAVEKRDWQGAGEFIAAEYHDRWRHDKENVLAQCAQVFAQFLFCNIQGEERSLTFSGDTAIFVARLALGGTGGPLADYAKQRVNSLTEPFAFTWTRQSWKPWDWQLVEAGQPQLEIPDALEF